MLGLLLGAAIPLACGLDPVVGGPEATEIEALVATHCEAMAACDCQGLRTFESDSACTSDLSTLWDARRTEGKRRGLSYDAECFTSLQEDVETFECYWPGGAAPLCNSFCATYYGAQELGEPCEGFDAQVSDCAQGLVCHEGACAEPCAVLGGRQQGEPCATTDFGRFDDCAPSLTCSFATGTCEPGSGVGQSCDVVPCNTGLLCVFDDQTFNSTCRIAPTAGQPCAQGSCADGHYCDWQDGAQICRTYAGLGESCGERPCAEELWCGESLRCEGAPGLGQPCLFGSICDEGLACDFDFDRCVAAPPIGQPCVAETCEPGAWCDFSQTIPEGVCAPLVVRGEMCSGHRQCETGYCPNGFCASRPGKGDDCEQTEVCGAGLVCNGSRCVETITRAPAVCSYPGW